MRNLSQYPVTQEELVEFVGHLYSEELEQVRLTGLCGDMKAEYLHTIFNNLKTGEWKV